MRDETSAQLRLGLRSGSGQVWHIDCSGFGQTGGASIMRWSPWALTAAAFGLAGCASIQASSALSPGPSQPPLPPAVVQLTALEPPPAARELALVQVHSDSATLEQLLSAFVREVARRGGDVAKVDSIATRFEEQEEVHIVSVDCGTDDAPLTCTHTETVTVEVGTTRVLGHAFRSGRKP